MLPTGSRAAERAKKKRNRVCSVNACSSEMNHIGAWRVARPKRYLQLVRPPEPEFVDVYDRWSCATNKGHTVYICPFCSGSFFTSGHLKDKRNFSYHIWEDGCDMMEEGAIVPAFQDERAPKRGGIKFAAHLDVSSKSATSTTFDTTTSSSFSGSVAKRSKASDSVYRSSASTAHQPSLGFTLPFSQAPSFPFSFQTNQLPRSLPPMPLGLQAPGLPPAFAPASQVLPMSGRATLAATSQGQGPYAWRSPFPTAAGLAAIASQQSKATTSTAAGASIPIAHRDEGLLQDCALRDLMFAAKGRCSENLIGATWSSMLKQSDSATTLSSSEGLSFSASSEEDGDLIANETSNETTQSETPETMKASSSRTEGIGKMSIQSLLS